MQGRKSKPVGLSQQLKEELLSTLKNLYKTSDILEWKCKICTGIWLATVDKRVNHNQGCPYCCGQKILRGFNDLESQFPEIGIEYSDKNILKAFEISSKSGKSVLWDCSKCSMTYHSIVGNRTNLKRGRPYCSGAKPIPGVTDLLTVEPKICLEWSPNNKNPPTNYTRFSNNEVEWICAQKHIWNAAISTRSSGKNCKKCSLAEKVSKGEQSLALYVLEILKSFESNDAKSINKINELSNETLRRNDRAILSGKEIDIYIPSHKLGIEYNGDYWHSDEVIFKNLGKTSKTAHREKQELAESKGITLLYVWESDWLAKNNEVKDAIKRAIANISDIDPILQILTKD